MKKTFEEVVDKFYKEHEKELNELYFDCARLLVYDAKEMFRRILKIIQRGNNNESDDAE